MDASYREHMYKVLACTLIGIVVWNGYMEIREFVAGTENSNQVTGTLFLAMFGVLGGVVAPMLASALGKQAHRRKAAHLTTAESPWQPPAIDLMGIMNPDDIHTEAARHLFAALSAREVLRWDQDGRPENDLDDWLGELHHPDTNTDVKRAKASYGARFSVGLLAIRLREHLSEDEARAVITNEALRNEMAVSMISEMRSRKVAFSSTLVYGNSLKTKTA